MSNDKVQLFEDRPIRTAWVEDEEEWYFFDCRCSAGINRKCTGILKLLQQNRVM